MSDKTKKIVAIAGIIILVAGLATGGIVLLASAGKRRKEKELEMLLDIARKEGNLSAAGQEKFRKLIYLDDYALPIQLQNAFNKIKPLLEKAGNGIRQGYAVSSMQYFNDIERVMSTESVAVRNEFNTVKGLLQEAFKLNSTSDSSQQKLASANEKSYAWWRVVLEVVMPVPTIAISQDSALLSTYKKYRNGVASPESKNFNQKLIDQSWNTLKLFSEAYKALSGGKDYFSVQKNPQ